ncbi:MAG: hypothetical protein FWE68_02725 [Defluviitaleaceae bacterium]|nr:hypothetical protein [Defluviitaleaceae bacterium]
MNNTPPNKRKPQRPQNPQRSQKPQSGAGRGGPAQRAGQKPPSKGEKRYRSPEERAAERAAYPRGRREPKRRSIPIMTITGIIFLIVIAYMFDSVMRFTNRIDLPSESVRMGTLDIPVIFQGIIVRDETVYTAPISGVASYMVNDLDRVRAGTLIGEIRDAETSETAAYNLAEAERALLRMHERRSEISAFARDVDNIYLQVKNVVDNRALPSLQQADFAGIYEVRDAINSNLNLRNQIVMNESRGTLETLANERQHFETELNRSISSVHSERSGVVSFVIDGLEDVLTLDRLDDLTPEETHMLVDYSNMVRVREAEEGDPLFKIINSNAWYIAAYIPVEYVNNWNVGDHRTIYIQDGGSSTGVEMRVDRVERGGAEFYVVLRSTRNLLDFLHLRNVRFKITSSEHTGYKIPTAAITTQTLLKVPREYMIDDDGLKLIKYTENGEETISVRMQYSDSHYFYVFQDMGRLVLHDRIRMPNAPYTIHNLSDVHNVRGVFVVNRGYAEFRRITIDHRIPLSGEYVILDPSRNPELRLHDRISADARTLSPHQKIVD